MIGIADRIIGLLLALVPRPAERRGVAVLMNGGIGDAIVFSVMAPRFLPLTRAGERLTVVLRSDSAKVGFLYPSDRFDVAAVDYKDFLHDFGYRLRTSLRFHRMGLRLVISADYHRHPLFDERLIAACGAEETVAMEARSWGKYAKLLERNRAHFDRLFASGGEGRHRLLRWTDFTNWLTGHNDPPPVVRVDEADLPPPAGGDGPLVILHPFASDQRKQHPLDLYRRIIDSLPPETRFLLTGGPKDLESSPEFSPLLEHERVEYCGAGFADLVPLMRGAALVVSVDTSVMHLAAALGTPTIGLGNAAWVGDIVPYPDEACPDSFRFLFHEMPCAGCLQDCDLPAEDGRFPCVARLDHDRVLTAVDGAFSVAPINPGR